MKERFNATGLLVGLLIFGLILLALFGGYKFATHFNNDVKNKYDEVGQTVEDEAKTRFGIDFAGMRQAHEQKKQEREQQRQAEREAKEREEAEKNKPYEYSVPDTRDYDGTKIYECLGYLYNDNGDVNINYHEENNYGLNALFDADKKYCVFKKKQNLYLIDANMEHKQLSTECSNCGISYNGECVFYTKAGDLWTYNPETEEERFIMSGVYKPCVSPDGKSFAYYSYVSGMDKALFVKPDGKDPIMIDDDDDNLFVPIAVSNGGNTVFYYVYRDNDTVFYCYHDGDTKKLAKGEYVRTTYFNRDCEKVIFTMKDTLYYYDIYSDDVKKLVKSGSLDDVTISAAHYCYIDDSRLNMIIDTDNLSDVAMVSSSDSSYCFEGVIPEPVLMRDSGYASECAIVDGVPTCVYREDGRVHKAVYKDHTLTDTILREDLRVYNDIEFCEDLTSGVVTIHEQDASNNFVNNVYYFSENADPVMLGTTGSHNYDAIRWDKTYKKCYYICDGNLYSVNKDGTDSQLVFENADRFTYMHLGDRAHVFKDTDGIEHVLINSQVYDR
jgi:hypothetical protein